MAIIVNPKKIRGVFKQPTAKITSSVLSNAYKVLDFSGLFEFKDYLGNSLVVGDTITITIRTLQSNTYIGSGTMTYGDNLTVSTPISSDTGFDNYILPFLTGTLVDGGSYVFDKYNAVSFWNGTNGGLAGVNLGEDWIITVSAIDSSLGTFSVNTDNTGSFDKSLKYRNSSLIISAGGSSKTANGLGFFVSLPNEGFVWNDSITLEVDGVSQPNVPINSYILSNARANYVLGTYNNTLRDYYCTGTADNWPDFQLPGLYNEKLTQIGVGFNYGGNFSGVNAFSATPNDVTVTFRLGTRDAPNQAQAWEIWVSDLPDQAPLDGTRVFNLLNPAEAAQATVPHTFTGGEGKYRLLTRHIDTGVTEAYGDHELLIFSI